MQNQPTQIIEVFTMGFNRLLILTMVCVFLGFPAGYAQNIDVVSGNTSAISKYQDSIRKKDKKKRDGK